MQKGFDQTGLEELCKAIVNIHSVDECEKLFDDILTINEIKAISQRLEVAKLLDKGEVYNVIASKTGASTATISRVNRCLNYGSGGYRIVLERMKNEQK